MIVLHCSTIFWNSVAASDFTEKTVWNQLSILHNEWSCAKTHSCVFCSSLKGIEPIIHENISVHMCSSISKSISGLVVIFVGQSLATSNTDHMTICEIMVITFIMCYTITLTMMEPLQASIKAVYICFAQNQQSLSQAFPLLYNRLDRLSREQGSNMV